MLENSAGAHYAQHYAGMSCDVVLASPPAGCSSRLPISVASSMSSASSSPPAPRPRNSGSSAMRENRALGLYERLGFRPVGQTGVHLRMEWDPATALT